MRNTTIFILLAIIISACIILFLTTNKSETKNYDDNSTEVQIVKLYLSGGKYILDPPEIKKDIKVRLIGDISKLPGCSRAIVIPEFGVSKVLSSSSNVVEFMPDKIGTFNIACSMNMYSGQITVR